MDHPNADSEVTLMGKGLQWKPAGVNCRMSPFPLVLCSFTGTTTLGLVGAATSVNGGSFQNSRAGVLQVLRYKLHL